MRQNPFLDFSGRFRWDQHLRLKHSHWPLVDHWETKNSRGLPVAKLWNPMCEEREKESVSFFFYTSHIQKYSPEKTGEEGSGNKVMCALLLINLLKLWKNNRVTPHGLKGISGQPGPWRKSWLHRSFSREQVA